MSGALLREVNLRIYEFAHRHDFGDAEFLCECHQPDCGVTTVGLQMTDFADCLAAEGCALVAPGHHPAGTEIIRQANGYLLVRATARR